MIKYLSIILVWCLVGCGTNERGHNESSFSTTVSVVSDETDKHQLRVKANALLPLFNCEENSKGQCAFRLRPITDRQLTPLSFCKLPEANVSEQSNTRNDPQHRRKIVDAFYTRVHQIVEDVNGMYDTLQELRNSECIRSISAELQFLSSDTSNRKFLVVYSNLREKSDLYDSYLHDELSSIMIATKIEGLKIMPEKLQGITVIFVFEARDRKEDKIYMRLAEAYKMVIERKGGVVIFQATDNGFVL